MRISELIAELQKYDPETPVLVMGYEGEYDHPKNISLKKMQEVDGPYYYGQFYEYNEGEDYGYQAVGMAFNALTLDDNRSRSYKSGKRVRR